MDFYDGKSSEPELRSVWARLLGTGAAAPTKVYGKGITVARTGVGVYTLTFTGSPGTWVGANVSLEATTPAGLAVFSVVVTATSSTVTTVNLYNAAAALTDLAAAQWINLSLNYKASNA